MYWPEGVLASNSCNVAFTSSATDVVGGVTIPNEVYLSSCTPNNLAAGFLNTRLVSADNAGTPADIGAQQPAISGDGRFVAFVSTSTNLPGAPGGGLGAQNIYVRDTCTGATACSASTTMASVDGGGNPIAGSSQLPAISDDGRFIVFSTQTPAPGGGLTSTVWIRDTCNSSGGPVAGCFASTTIVSQGAAGAANGLSNSSQHAVSADGCFVVFDSSATNLVSPPTTGNQVFVRDTCMSSVAQFLVVRRRRCLFPLTTKAWRSGELALPSAAMGISPRSRAKQPYSRFLWLRRVFEYRFLMSSGFGGGVHAVLGDFVETARGRLDLVAIKMVERDSTFADSVTLLDSFCYVGLSEGGGLE